MAISYRFIGLFTVFSILNNMRVALTPISKIMSSTCDSCALCYPLVDSLIKRMYVIMPIVEKAIDLRKN